MDDGAQGQRGRGRVGDFTVATFSSTGWLSRRLRCGTLGGDICLARLAYLRVLRVSSNWSDDGETAQIIAETEVPESESRSRRVSFESRYGTWEIFFDLSARALMQLARESSERLMFRPSRSRCPVLSVLYARSEPARSIIDRRACCRFAPRCGNALWTHAYFFKDFPGSECLKSFAGALFATAHERWDRVANGK